MDQAYTYTCSISGGAVTVNSTSVSGVTSTRVRTDRTVSGYIYVAGRLYDPATDGPLPISNGAQSVQAIKAVILDPPAVSTPSWSMTVPDGTLVNIAAAAANPSYIITGNSYGPYRVTSDYSGYYFGVEIPGKVPQTEFASADATSDDSVGTVNIPITMTLPPGFTAWNTQSFVYWIDASGTAEYGTDYKTTGGELFFYSGKVPSPRNIALKIIPNGRPGKRTVVLKGGIGASTSILGPYSTFTYTIDNPFRITATRASGMVNLTWDSAADVQYTIESTADLETAN